MRPKKNALKVLLAIPTYNNKEGLRPVVLAALKTRLDVLVVNDGSTDGAMDTLKGLKCRIVSLPSNQGKGSAIVAAGLAAQAQGYTHVLTLDADGQHAPSECKALLALAEQEPESIVVGCRDFEHSQAPGSSRFGRQFSNFWVWACSGVWPADAQCGYRVYPAAALTQLACKGRRYNYEVEILVRGAWAGLLLLDAPISVRYDEETRKASHFKAFWDNARISWTFTLLFTRNFVPWPHKVIFNALRHAQQRLKVVEPKQSLLKLLREASNPLALGAAVAVGLLCGTLPIPGFHIWASLGMAMRLRLNRVLAVGVQNFCAPPFVPVAAFELGHYLLHGRWFVASNPQEAWDMVIKSFHLRLAEYALGAVLLAFPLALAGGLMGWGLAALLQRRARL
jgi:uncharacterized protein (DUF2062 family)